MKKAIAIITTALALSFTSTFVWASDADLEKRVSDLEERVAALEAMLEGNSENADAEDSFTLGSGLYVAGEDIDTGTYRLVITEGVGYVDVFSSYDEFVNEKGSHYKALYSILMATEEVKQDLVDLGHATTAGQYVTEITSLNLKEGMCLNIDNVTATCVKTK